MGFHFGLCCQSSAYALKLFGGGPSLELRDKNLGLLTCKYLGNIKNSTHLLLISCLSEEEVLNQEIQNLVESGWFGHLRLLQYQKWETSLERDNPLSLAGPVTELVLFFQMSDHCHLVSSQG